MRRVSSTGPATSRLTGCAMAMPWLARGGTTASRMAASEAYWLPKWGLNASHLGFSMLAWALAKAVTRLTMDSERCIVALHSRSSDLPAHRESRWRARDRVSRPVLPPEASLKRLVLLGAYASEALTLPKRYHTPCSRSPYRAPGACLGGRAQDRQSLYRDTSAAV